MPPGTRTDLLLRVLCRKIAAIRHMAPSLAFLFDPMDRLARDVVGRSPDGATTGEQLQRAPAPSPAVSGNGFSGSAHQQAIERVALLEVGLTRAIEYERLELGMSAAELGRQIQRRSLDFSGQIRILYFLTLTGPTAWKVLRSVDLPDRMMPTLDPVLRALRTLLGSEHRHLRSMHRFAVEHVEHSPLGFCRLVIEEALTLLRASEHANFAPLTYLDQLLNDPFLAVTAPPQFADLRARIHLYLAQHRAIASTAEEALARLHEGTELMVHGTMAPELKALGLEAQAMTAIRNGDLEDSLRSLMRANVILAEVHLPDRRAETLLEYSLALSAHSHEDPRAALVLESTLAMLVGLESQLAPALRLRLLHFLALVEIRRAHGRLPHPSTGVEAQSPRHVGRLRRRVTEWAGEVHQHHLDRAADHLRAAETLYAVHGTPLLSVHRSRLLGQALLFKHPDLALIYLLDAQSGFESAGRSRLALATGRDVAICLAYLDRGSECNDWLENLCGRPASALPAHLELLQDLRMLTGELLGGGDEAVDADRMMARILDLEPPMDRRPVEGASPSRLAQVS